MRPSSRPFVAFLLLALCTGTPVLAQETDSIALSGRWHFALDPHVLGEKMGWHRGPLDASKESGFLSSQWDQVQVPHTWSIDARYLGYIGRAWYRKQFTVPKDLDGKHLRLAFDAVFYEARVWVNGTRVARHEGGYTPFRVDVTPHVDLGEENVIAVEVNNTWSRTTIPGARFGSEPSDQVYPWWDYGGIIRDVHLLSSAPVYVENQKVVATPDLEEGTATVEATAWVVNATDTAQERQLTVSVLRAEGRGPVAHGRRDDALRTSVRVPARDTQVVRMQTRLRSEDVSLWHPDRPHLYLSRASLRPGPSSASGAEGHLQNATFGIRRVEFRDAGLFLNGERVKMGGANRHSDYPGVGNVEPDSVIRQDLTLLKEGNMQLMRLHHYPSSKNALRWADRNGMLLIGEAGSWGFGPEKLSHPDVRALFRSQTREMVRRDWNHPSIIAWSVGNEYQSDTPEGVRWTRDMYDFVKELDTSRPVTFVALGDKLKAEGYENPTSTSFQYVDFICANFYYSPEESGRRLDATHAQWPDKPILITEWGRRADRMEERDRAQYIRDFVEMVRGRDYVVGASFWSYNDYRSRYPGTNKDGYRHWGLVNAQREPRTGYHAIREELAPVTIDGEAKVMAGGTIQGQVKVTGRADFPRYTIRGYNVKAYLVNGQGRTLAERVQTINKLSPGESSEFEFNYEVNAVGQIAHLKVEVVQPTGFRILDSTIEVRE